MVTETLDQVMPSATQNITATWLPGPTLPSRTQFPLAQPTPAPQRKPNPFFIWLLILTGCGVFIVFSTTSLIDPRPKELRNIADRVVHISHDEE